MSENSHLTSYVKMASTSPFTARGAEEPPPQVESLVSAPFHSPVYECLIEEGSTSKPTMREPCAPQHKRGHREAGGPMKLNAPSCRAAAGCVGPGCVGPGCGR